MVNKILKYKYVLGEFVGLWAWRNFRGVAAAAVLPLALALAGCEEEAETRLQTSQPEAPENVLEPEKSGVEEFTTEGKPTKTIETPWGPREIYDPAQDDEVREALNKANMNSISAIQNDKIINSAMSAYRNALFSNNCLTVVDAFCRICSVSSKIVKTDETFSPVCSQSLPSFTNLKNKTMAVCYRNANEYLRYVEVENLQEAKENTQRLEMVLNQTCAVWKDNNHF